MKNFILPNIPHGRIELLSNDYLPARQISGAEQNGVICSDNRFAFLILLVSHIDVQQTNHKSHSDFGAFDIK